MIRFVKLLVILQVVQSVRRINCQSPKRYVSYLLGESTKIDNVERTKIMKRVAVFLDGANCFYTQKKMGWKIDAEKLLAFCKRYGEVVEAIYYSGISNDGGQKKYLDKLAYIGYSLITKPVKSMYDVETGKVTLKANLDIEIVLDMLSMIDRYDIAILISGDGDFSRALQQLKSRGKEIKVISTRGSVSSELVYAMGINYIDLLDIRETVERKMEGYPIQNIVGSKVKAA